MPSRYQVGPGRSRLPGRARGEQNEIKIESKSSPNRLQQRLSTLQTPPVALQERQRAIKGVSGGLPELLGSAPEAPKVPTRASPGDEKVARELPDAPGSDQNRCRIASESEEVEFRRKCVSTRPCRAKCGSRLAESMVIRPKIDRESLLRLSAIDFCCSGGLDWQSRAAQIDSEQPDRANPARALG